MLSTSTNGAEHGIIALILAGLQARVELSILLTPLPYWILPGLRFGQ